MAEEHWRDEFASMGMDAVVAEMVREGEAPDPRAAMFESSSYADAVELIEEAETLTGVEMPTPIRAALLQRAEERDEARERRSTAPGHWREFVAEAEAA